MFSLSTLHFKLEKLKDPVHLCWRLYRQASRLSKRRTLHIGHMHAAVHGSVTYGANLSRNRNLFHSNQRFQAIEFEDRPVPEKLDIGFLFYGNEVLQVENVTVKYKASRISPTVTHA